MIAALCVGAGGFCGAIARYLLGLLPYQGQFPLINFIINFTGAVAIGAVVEAASIRPGMLPPNAVLFVKTGLCGGFTTFSTFSLETLGLLERGEYAIGGAYALGSLAVCVLGVVAGKMLVRWALGTQAAWRTGGADREASRGATSSPRLRNAPAPDTVQQCRIVITSDAPDSKAGVSNPAIRLETRKSRPQRQALQTAYRPKQQAKATSP